MLFSEYTVPVSRYRYGNFFVFQYITGTLILIFAKLGNWYRYHLPQPIVFALRHNNEIPEASVANRESNCIFAHSKLAQEKRERLLPYGAFILTEKKTQQELQSGHFEKKSVLRIRDVYPGSELLHLGSLIQGQKDSGSRIRIRIKEF
jgi:hypothetical protein